RTNRTVEELKKSLELARREERMEELKRAATGDGNIERIDGQIQIGNAQWRNDPFDVNSIERDFNPAREGQQFKDRARHIIESEFRFRHPNVDQDSAKHSATQMVEDIDPEDGRISRHMLVCGSPIYKRAFGKLVAGGPAFLSTEEAQAVELSRALSLTG